MQLNYDAEVKNEAKEGIIASDKSISQREKMGVSRSTSSAEQIGWSVSWISSSAQFGTPVTTGRGLAGVGRAWRRLGPVSSWQVS